MLDPSVQLPDVCNNDNRNQWLLRKEETQNNHLIGVWMPGSFIDQREKGNEELKSKGRIEREVQWGSKVSVFSLVKHLQGNGQPSKGVC